METPARAAAASMPAAAHSKIASFQETYLDSFVRTSHQLRLFVFLLIAVVGISMGAGCSAFSAAFGAAVAAPTGAATRAATRIAFRFRSARSVACRRPWHRCGLGVRLARSAVAASNGSPHTRSMLTATTSEAAFCRHAPQRTIQLFYLACLALFCVCNVCSVLHVASVLQSGTAQEPTSPAQGRSRS